MDLFDLKGKSALVTGGNGGIGLGMARGLAAAGARVAIAGRDANKNSTALASLGRDCLALKGDVADEKQCRAMVEEAAAGLGRLDILVNNAGINIRKAPQEYALEEWKRVLDVNLTSTFLCCKAAIAPMRERNAGRIVNLASIAGKEGNAGMTGYSAAKAGVIALTKSLGKELATTEIRVNAIAPAVIATDLVKQMSDDTYRNVLAKIPLGRAGRPDEVAAMAAWLASDECSFSTGAVFDLSGGRATY